MTKHELKNQGGESSKPPARLRAAGASALELALTHSPERVRRGAEDMVLRRIIRTQGNEVRLLTDYESIQTALKFEQKIWHEENYGDLAEYSKYLPQSRIFAVFDSGRCLGMMRLFDGAAEIPPFLDKMPITDPVLKEQLIKEGKQYKVEEFGTVAVAKELRGGRTFLDICRRAWRDASERGIQTWGIIMEPERVEKMNQGLGFSFKQIGPVVDYQGGECAAHIMDFDEVRTNMRTVKPELYNWFVNQPL